MSIDKIKNEYPLHFLVWNNDFKELEDALKNGKHDIEKLDTRKRTPLLLAVKLCHLQCVKLLLQNKCNANYELNGWSIVQEAVCTGDHEIVSAVLNLRDLQRHQTRVAHVPQLLEKLKNTPDFFVEMKWEFASWLPLMSKICPSDVYKVYKRGANVRIDTTLTGFDTTWQRGNRSYVFKGLSDHAVMYEFDHDEKTYAMEEMKNFDVDFLNGIPPTKESVQGRLGAPVISNNIDMEKISFERNKTGFWGWRSEKNETINNYDCRVYSASNVEFITKTRTEHLNGDVRVKNSRTPLQHFLGMAEDDFDHTSACDVASNRRNSSPFLTPDEAPKPKSQTPTEENASGGEINTNTAPTIEEYFSDIDLDGRDIGRPARIQTKVQKFKANLWLCDDFPIKLQEQVLPILDLMSSLASPHVSKLRDFITVSMPSGFPIKVEIPLFHVLNAVITFGNVFSLENPVQHVSVIKEEENEGRVTCIIEDEVFEVPSGGYINRVQAYRRQVGFEDDDELVQYAIQQSLIETGTENDEVDIWEALRAQRPITPNNYPNNYMMDEELQRALQESLLSSSTTNNQTDSTNSNNYVLNNNHGVTSDYDLDENLQLAIKMSEEEERLRKKHLQEEQELLEQVLKLSLQEK